MQPDKYCIDLHNFEKVPVREVKVGDMGIGGSNPIRIQSMTNCSVNDIEKSLEQIINIFDAGADLVRVSTASILELENLKEVKARLRKLSYNKPLVADIHYSPKIAEEAARVVEKIRINPGNYIDKNISRENNHEYSETEYQLELEKIHERLLPLIKICKEHGTCIRIGSNHGSLSQRILNKYGNTVQAMVESAVEYLQIFFSENFYNIVVSMKSSDARTMVKASRLLNARMMQASALLPQHIGLTEAGIGSDARLKSAVAIGSLLNDGIGNTLRVSLSENPVNEVIFASKILSAINEKERKTQIPYQLTNSVYKPYSNDNNSTKNPEFEEKFIIIGNENGSKPPDLIFIDDMCEINFSKKYLLPFSKLNKAAYSKNIFPLFNLSQINKSHLENYKHCFVELNCFDLNKEDYINTLSEYNNFSIVLNTITDNQLGEVRFAYKLLKETNKSIPIIIKHYCTEAKGEEELLAEIASFPGAAFIDSLASGLWLCSTKNNENLTDLSYDLLQAVGLRLSSPEFISCPCCGRTSYNLEQVAAKVKEHFKNYKNIKIAVMGCSVNGPGEMADADYGCVGSKPGYVNIYKGQKIVKRAVEEKNIVKELEQAINH